MKHTEKHFGGINIGDLGKMISYICLKLLLRVNCIMCACCPSGMVDKEGETPHETCKLTYVVESCGIHGHHV